MHHFRPSSRGRRFLPPLGAGPMVKKHMPSPVGHALAGAAAAWAVDLLPGRRALRVADPTVPTFDRFGGRLTLACAAVAAMPDLDLLLARHRTFTHSVTALVITSIVAGLVTEWVTRANG